VLSVFCFGYFHVFFPSPRQPKLTFWLFPHPEAQQPLPFLLVPFYIKSDGFRLSFRVPFFFLEPDIPLVFSAKNLSYQTDLLFLIQDLICGGSFLFYPSAPFPSNGTLVMLLFEN